MKRLFFAVMLALAFATANAQTPTTTTPQGVTSVNFFNAITTSQTSSSFQNLGQTMHFVIYQGTGATGGPTGVQIRIEGSFDGVTFVPISDDGTDPGGTSIVILAVGAYPFVRANLVKCTSCNGNNSITASYFGTSSMPGNPFGVYGSGQQIRKVAFVNASTDVTANTVNFQTPYGSSAGFLLLSSSGAFPASSTINVRTGDLNSAILAGFTLPTSGALAIAFPIPATPALSVNVRYTHVGSTSQTFSAWYFFYPPGGAQPPTSQPGVTANGEATAAVNTAVVTTLAVAIYQRAHLFNVNARCSAGTAQLTVADGATQIWSSAATEVGTTSFTKFWDPGLPSSFNNNLVVTLGTCGVGNTGTLDVQGSVF